MTFGSKTNIAHANPLFIHEQADDAMKNISG